VKVFTVFGVSDSGKTTTVEHLIKEMRRRGYGVGTVKNIHFEEFALDTEGTNTWRHRKAGSEMVAAWGLYETDLIIPRRLDINELLAFFNLDYVILEGFSDIRVPKILCARSETEIEERLDDLVFVLSGRISNSLFEYRGVPAISALKEIVRLGDLIETVVPEYDLSRAHNGIPVIDGMKCQ
jgi:molybdopterin-guanine dinucleotide biosynthesis protein B